MSDENPFAPKPFTPQEPAQQEPAAPQPSFGQLPPQPAAETAPPFFGQQPPTPIEPATPKPSFTDVPAHSSASFEPAPSPAPFIPEPPMRAQLTDSPLVSSADEMAREQTDPPVKRKIKPLWIFAALGLIVVIALVVVFTTATPPQATPEFESTSPVIEPVIEQAPPVAVETPAPSPRETACANHFDEFYRKNNLNPADYPNEKAEYLAKCVSGAN